MSLTPRWILLAFVAGCNQSSLSQDACHDLCTELMTACDYDAFPNLQSCLSGCEWNVEQGADIDGQLTCVQAATCNTFEIMECEHAYGLD